jgi:hypothetical protein
MRPAHLRALLSFATSLLVGCSKPSAPSADTSASGTSAATQAAAASSTPLDVRDSIVFKKADPAVGATYSETSVTNTQIEITAPSASSVVQKRTTSSNVTLLAVDGKTILKVKVAYRAHSTAETSGGKNTTKTDPVQGKTYVAEYKGKKVLVTSEDQKPVSSQERNTVRADFEAILGKPDPLLTGVPDKTLRVGDSVDSLAEVLRGMLTGDGDVRAELSNMSVVLDQIGPIDGQPAGIFLVKAKAKIPGKQQIDIYLSGSMIIRQSDSRLLAVRLNGPLTLSTEAVKGHGGVSVALKRTY